MDSLYDALIAPFADYNFMRRALVACFMLAISGAPLGVLLSLRRMSLMGEAVAHSILPGIAAGFLFAGLSLPFMSLGGLLAGLIVALLAGLASRLTKIREDASITAFYQIALAIGVVLLSLKGSALDLMHILVGNILGVDNMAMIGVGIVMTATLLTLAIIWRPLLVESFDPVFLRTMGGSGALCHLVFLMLVTLNLVAGFQALGTLMSMGLLILPAIAARYWSRHMSVYCVVAAGIGCVSSLCGLLLSWHADLPSGPAIILVIGAILIASMLFGTQDSIRTRYFPSRHLEH